MWHPEPFVKHPIPRDSSAHRGGGGPVALVQPAPLRPARPDRAHLGSGHGALAGHRRRAGHAGGPGVVRALRARAARGAGRRGDRNPGHSQRTAPPDRARPVHPRPGRAGAHRPSGERRTDPAVHPDHRLPPDPPPAGAGAILPGVPGPHRSAPRPVAGHRRRHPGGAGAIAGGGVARVPERAGAREPAIRRAGAGHRYRAASHSGAATGAAGIVRSSGGTCRAGGVRWRGAALRPRLHHGVVSLRAEPAG